MLACRLSLVAKIVLGVGIDDSYAIPAQSTDCLLLSRSSTAFGLSLLPGSDGSWNPGDVMLAHTVNYRAALILRVSESFERHVRHPTSFGVSTWEMFIDTEALSPLDALINAWHRDAEGTRNALTPSHGWV